MMLVCRQPTPEEADEAFAEATDGDAQAEAAAEGSRMRREQLERWAALDA